MTMTRLILWWVLAGAFSGSASAVDVVEKWLEGQAGIKSLRAEFTQQRLLRQGKRPIVSEGKFSYAAPGSFRWQVGDPAVTLAVQEQGGDLVVANVRRKKAKIYPLALLGKDEAALGFSFVGAGFPKTMAEFKKNFSVEGVEHRDGEHHVTVTFNDRKSPAGLRKMVFYIGEGTYDLRGFYLRFRDSSSIATRFKKVQKNAALPAGEFKVDLSGFQATTHPAK